MSDREGNDDNLDCLVSSESHSSNGTPQPLTNVTNTSVPCGGTGNDSALYEGPWTGYPNTSSTTDTCAGSLHSIDIYYIALVSLMVHGVL